MPKQKTGYVKKTPTGYQAVVTYVDPATGRRKFLKQSAPKKALAVEALPGLVRKADELQTGAVRRHDPRMTLAELVGDYLDARCRPVVRQNGIRISGVGSPEFLRQSLRPVVAALGTKLVAHLRPADIEAYRDDRLTQKSRRVVGGNKGPGRRRPVDPETADFETISISTVNKELGQLRACLRWAVREGILAASPFDRMTGLIQREAEAVRWRVLTLDEERALLAALEIPKRRHLVALVVAALDTGLRRGELQQLTWNDWDREANVLRIRPETSKTNRARIVGVTPRLAAALVETWETSAKIEASPIFGKHEVKKAMQGASRDAGLDTVWFTDLRHTAISRMVAMGVPHAEIMKISGHEETETFLRYVNPTDERARNAAEALARFAKQ